MRVPDTVCSLLIIFLSNKTHGATFDIGGRDFYDRLCVMAGSKEEKPICILHMNSKPQNNGLFDEVLKVSPEFIRHGCYL